MVQQETDAGSKTDDRLCIGAKLLHSTHGIAIRFQRGNQIHQAIEDHQCRHNIERDTDKRPSEQHGHKAGDKLSFEAPTGRMIDVEIIDAKPFKG